MATIDEFKFDISTPAVVKGLKHYNHDVGENWPVVYVINNSKEAYVGETVNVSRRIEQHLQNSERKMLTEIRIITDGNFNKSVILDLESFLIKYMAADGKFRLQNGNNGLQDHDYFARHEYKEEFNKIWNRLHRLGITKNTIQAIENSELYKYSPYKSLGEEQLLTVQNVLKLLVENQEKEHITILIRGGAGTGKTILGIYMIKLLADAMKQEIAEGPLPDEYFEVDDALSLYALEQMEHYEKIGIVIPQKSLQTSLKDVFSGIKSLNKAMVLSPAEVVKDYTKTGKKFDILIVDEAHRLKCRYKGHLSNYRIFDRCNEDLGLDKERGTELDWIMKCSRRQILFRDERQTVRPCDIDADDFLAILCERYEDPIAQFSLDTQWRCQGGSDYTDYIHAILNQSDPAPREIEQYDFRLYTDCARMVKDIRAKNRELTLCHTVAGYAWPWNRNRPDDCTIEIQGRKYRWNRTYNNWIKSKTADEEIGCIHTVQGYDLNYCGVIIGEDLKYDSTENRIYADKACYYDQQGKSGIADDPEGLRKYLCNIYQTLLTRGIKGTYIYVCDDALREYFSRYIPDIRN